MSRSRVFFTENNKTEGTGLGGVMGVLLIVSFTGIVTPVSTTEPDYVSDRRKSDGESRETSLEVTVYRTHFTPVYFRPRSSTIDEDYLSLR